MLEVDRLGVTYAPATGVLRWVVQTASAKPIRALDDVTFDVGRGEVVGLVGPNGAGKSTLLRAITSLLLPTDGEIRIDGVPLDPDDASSRSRIGLMLPEERSFHWRLTGRQNLRYFAAMFGVDRRTADKRIEELMVRHGLANSDKAVFGYSSGMLAQLGMVRALLHRPSLLVLDEPTRSLDPIASADFCRQVREIASEDRAVLLTSHRLDDVVNACDRVLALVGGRLHWAGAASAIVGDPSGLGERLRQLVDEARTADSSPEMQR